MESATQKINAINWSTRDSWVRQLIAELPNPLWVDLPQNTGRGPRDKSSHVEIACYNSRKGKDSLTPTAFVGDYTARAAPQISMYSKTACLAVAWVWKFC